MHWSGKPTQQKVSNNKQVRKGAKTKISCKGKKNMPKKVKQGVVVSHKMEKTVVVKVASYNPHPKYKKIIETNKNYKAHDEKNICGEGDVVKIIESKPLSGSKNWAVLEVVQKAK